ncbi:MAG: Ig-like domain-containing protein [Bacteroidales bacterium]|nr:Ig-like domain-containing protein [Bacteroidales bacterium]
MLKPSPINAMRVLAAAVIALLMAACASMGRPEGGPKDVTPPVFVSSKPAPGTLNYNEPRVVITFDENIKVEDVLNKVVISPAQTQQPSVTASGRRLIVDLKDSLKPETTYTLDFSDAIRDLNEGNILDGFAMAFSTGDVLDTLQISGMVLQAENLEPAQGMLVGIYSNLADSAITTLPLERIARTNQLGQFTVRNLKPGDYRIFALNDLNRDLHWDRSEDVAFFDTIITPSSSNYNFQDTLKSSLEEDSIVTRMGTAYAPADVLLCWFNENYTPQYLKDYKRPTNKMLEVKFAAPSDSLPLLTIVNGDNAGRSDREWSRLDVNATRDTLNYWITDSAVILQDSLLVAMRYLRTDTLEQLSWTTDTLKFFYRPPKETKKKKKDDEEENDSLPKINFLSFNVLSQQAHDIDKPLMFEASQPLDTILPKGVRLEQMIDSVWTPIYRARIVPDSLHPLLRYRMDLEWEPGADYRLTIDSAAIQGAYNEHNRPITHEFKVKGLEEYANLYFKMAQRDLPLVVELLNSSDSPVLRTTVGDDGMAEFVYVQPGTYYARCFIDSNGDGKWTTGDLKQQIQPEEVYYYPGKLNLRKNWDIEQSWDIYGTALDMQKPMDIKKNKPVTRERQQSDQEEEEEDDFGDDMWNTSNKSYGTGSSYNNNHSGLQKAR